MLTRLADLAIARPRRVALLSLLAFVIAFAVGGPAANMFVAKDPFADPSSQSARAEQTIKRLTGAESFPGVLAVVAAAPGSPAVTEVASTIARQPDVARVTAPSAGVSSPLVSADGRSSVVAATLRSAPDPSKAVDQIKKALGGRHDVTLGGVDVAYKQTGDQALSDLGKAEAIAFPLLAILALLIFRGLAALLPLAVGALSVLTTFVVLRIINAILPLSVFALNLVILVGLGLAVDYSLFLVWRFREELSTGAGPEAALRTTMRSTGRTVIFSAVTVAAAMATLTVFPQRFLISMGLGGVVVALVGAAVALLMLPSLMILMTGRLGKTEPVPVTNGRWYRIAHAVMRRAWLVAIVTVAALLVLASPAPTAKFSGVDATVLPRSQSARVVQDTLRRDFPGLNGGQTIAVVATAPPSARAELAAYAHRLSELPGIANVSAPTQLGQNTWYITAGSPSDAISNAGQRAVEAVRAEPAPVPVRVGGPAADFRDQKSSIADSAPIAFVLLVIVTLVVLFVMTGSLILPLKTLVMNLLTAAAATGIVVFIFQHGRLTGPLAYTSQGGIEETDFLILLAVSFALSTDYGVFLLSRIKESRATAGGEREAIAVGLERTGRLVTYASLMLAVAIGAFTTSHVVFLKEVGVGIAVAVLIDAFVVRGLLVPSLMALLGRRNWWAPAPLARLHSRLGLEETSAPQPEEPVVPSTTSVV